eukprot:g36188.t1
MPSLLPTTRVHSTILTAVYIPPHADVKNALDEIYTTTNTLEIKFPEALFIMAGHFNQANLKQVMQNYHQHISCPIRGPNILDHCYTTIKVTYHSIPRPHFGKSDHSTVFLFPAYKQKLKQENQSQNEAAENLDENATTVTDFISKCMEDCVPKKSIQVFPNRKP